MRLFFSSRPFCPCSLNWILTPLAKLFVEFPRSYPALFTLTSYFSFAPISSFSFRSPLRNFRRVYQEFTAVSSCSDTLFPGEEEKRFSSSPLSQVLCQLFLPLRIPLFPYIFYFPNTFVSFRDVSDVSAIVRLYF